MWVVGNLRADTMADEGTVRKLYGSNVGENAVHGSDSEENGRQEVAYFFAESELTRVKG
jgi:nucleoside-diphosphate kinase